jgi:UDP-glucose 4-epimerase
MSFNVVITGASGFVGRALLCRLSQEGFSVIGATRRQLPDLVTVTNYADVPMPDDAVLVHLAQGSDVSGSFDDGDIELCRTLSSKHWRHIVYASSAVVYDDVKDSPLRPEEPVFATSDYTRLKLACEDIVLNVGGTCLRFANLYGPGMGANTVIADILRQIPGDGPLRLRDISPVRDFLWIEDAARCLAAACRKMPGGILNAGSGRKMVIGDVARLALSLAGEGSRPVVGMGNSGHASYLTLDVTKTRSLLDWSPEVDISEGLSSLLEDKKE